MKLSILPQGFGILKLSQNEEVPKWAFQGQFYSITRTREELSIVCEESWIPKSLDYNQDWKAIQVIGPLDFSLTGILSSLSAPLAQAGISIFVISTFDTDYLLVKAHQLDQAKEVLSTAGHLFV